MGDLFQKVIEMSLMGSVVILITVLARFILRNRSKRYIMILWAVVALRLLVPLNIQSEISIFNYLPKMTKPDTAVTEVQEAVLPDTVDINSVATDAVSHQDGIVEIQMPEETDVTAKELPDIMTVLAIVWLTGTAVITGYCSVRYIDLKRKLKNANRIGKNIYESEKVKAPFVFGLFVPKIYLPDVLNNTEREYILRHEKTHIKHGDWISKIVGMAVVAVHWFNPLVWLAYVLFERDIEMSCDESVVANMDAEVKKAYTMSLVTYAQKSRNRRYLVTPLGFSKNSFSKAEVTDRVKNIINFKEGRKITAVMITAAMLFVGAACSLNSKDAAKETTEVTGTITEVYGTAEASIDETEIETFIEDDEVPVPDYAIDPPASFELFVESLVGSPYETGGAFPEGFDDTGFVMYCFKKYFSVALPHDITALSECGEEIDPDEIEPGDVIFFDKDGDGVMDHCGIYVGNDTYIHAQSTASGVIESGYSDAMAKVGTVRRMVYISGDIPGEALG